MLLNIIAEKHPNSFVLLLPKARDEQNRVRDWQVLNTSRHYDEILKVAKYYRVEWVLFDTHTESVYEAEVDQLYKMI